MKLVWTNIALNNLAEIEDFIALDSPDQAKRFIKNLISQASVISQNPQIGRIVYEFSNPDIRDLIVKGYRVVYRISETKIEILTVFERHRLFNKDDVI